MRLLSLRLSHGHLEKLGAGRPLSPPTSLTRGVQAAWGSEHSETAARPPPPQTRAAGPGQRLKVSREFRPRHRASATPQRRREPRLSDSFSGAVQGRRPLLKDRAASWTSACRARPGHPETCHRQRVRLRRLLTLERGRSRGTTLRPVSTASGAAGSGASGPGESRG